MREAARRGFSHALQIDADGQHAAADVPGFLDEARAHPDAVICGQPVFDDSVPKSRLYGRYATHVWVWINTLSLDIRDSMCGFRVYPLAPLLALSTNTGSDRDGFDSRVVHMTAWRCDRNLRTRVTYRATAYLTSTCGAPTCDLAQHARLFRMLRRIPRCWRDRGWRDEFASMAERGETTFVAGIWLLYAVYRVLGRTPFRLLLYPVVFYHWLRHASARHASRQYLERLQTAHAVFERAPGVRHSLRHFACFAETLLDKILALGGRYGRGRIQFHGQEAVLAALAAGQGGLIVTAHMGCLELLQTAAGWRDGLRLTVLVHTAHAERFNRVLARANPASRVRLLQVASFSPATAMLLRSHAAGEFVASPGPCAVWRSGCDVPFSEYRAFPAGRI